MALQLWNVKTPNTMTMALELAGMQISKWFGGGISKKNYYCPKEISSIFAWRIFLMNILNGMIKNQRLNNLEVTYGVWHDLVRKELDAIIKENYTFLFPYDINENRFVVKIVDKFPVSRGNKNNKIIPFEFKEEIDIPIRTIHGSKGCTYDTTLVISSPKTNSEGGHWKKHWLQGEGEDKRVGYVATTRSKYLLVLGVPTLSQEDRKLLESYGFVSEDTFYNYIADQEN